MSFFMTVAAVLAMQGAAGWTWSLYEGDGPLVLANEIPDSPELRATLQCDPGSGAIDVSLYGEAPTAGFAVLRAGAATATSEARVSRGRLQTTIRADHPAFAAFVASGDMTVTVGDQQRRIEVQRPHLAKLRRFADRCAG